MSTEQRTAEEIEAELMGLDNTLREVEVEHLAGGEGEGNDAPDEQRKLAEAEASRKGWQPKGSYKGDPNKWVDAQTFLERGERFNANLQREVAELRQKLQDFEGTKAAFVKFHEETIAQKDREIEAAIKELRVQRSAAIREGEDEQAIALEDRIDMLHQQRKDLKKPLEEETPPAKATEPDANNPVLLEWIEDGNQWFRDEPKLRDFAIALGEDMVKNGETLRGRRFLDKVTERMAEEFPRRFRKSTETRAPQQPEGSGSGGSASHGKTERDLPPEDLKLMRQFIAEGYTTKEKFLKNYFSRH